MYLAKLVSDLTIFFSPEKFCRDFPTVDESYFISLGCRRDYICGFLQNLLSLFLNPYKKVPSSLEKALKQEISAFLDRVRFICATHCCVSDKHSVSLFDQGSGV